MTKDIKAEFWNRVDDVQAGMLTVSGQRAVPMSPYGDRDENAIWFITFITASGTDVAQAAQAGTDATLHIADAKANLYADVQGSLKQVNDPKKLDELWNAIAAAWFKDGRDDDAVRLVRMTPTQAEVWATDGAAGFLYEIAKAHLTDSAPDMGDHGTVHFQ